MSKSRLHARLRQNDEYMAMIKEIKRLGLRHRVELPPGKGQHPRLFISDGETECSMQIAGTPRRYNLAGELKKLRRVLAAAGFIQMD